MDSFGPLLATRRWESYLSPHVLMSTRRRHHRRSRSSTSEGLHIDDGKVEGIHECRAAFRSDDGTLIDTGDGREALKTEMHGGFKTALTCLAVAAATLLSIPVGIAIVKLSLLVLQR
jgi:hypothetical protein